MKKVLALFAILSSLTLFAEQNVFFDEDASSPLLGGKAANLHLLRTIPNIEVPRWFCISSRVFEQFLIENGITWLVQKLDYLCGQYEQNEEEILLLSCEIQSKIAQGEIRTCILKELKNAYARLANGQNNASFAVRSSGVLEDLSHSSFAGLYDTFLNQKGWDGVHSAMKKVWASSFTVRLIKERARSGISQKECSIAVIVQRMVEAKAAGVASSLELSSNYPGIEIAANDGLGESVVSGEFSVDKWLIHPEKHYIIKSVLGEKTAYSVSDERGGTRVQEREKATNQLVLSNEKVLEIASAVKDISSFYGCHVDTEFAIDQEDTLVFLQARPLVNVQKSKIYVVDPEAAKRHRVIAKGNYSVPGVAQGKVKFIDKWEELATKNIAIEPDDIVVAYISLNYWSHYLTHFKGLITKQGGPSTHPILLCRERQVPCLIGIDDDFEQLRAFSGKTITLDGINRVVYEGAVQLKESDPADLAKAFEPVQIKSWLPLEKRQNELMKGNYLFFHEGKYWLKNPTYPQRKFLQEIHLKRFERLPSLTLGKAPFKMEAKVIENYVCSVLNSVEKNIQLFSGMTLEDCEKYSQNQEKNIQDYLDITNGFELTPILWQKYVDVLVDLRAYIWVGEIFRYYLEREMEKLANWLAVPEFYLEECCAYIQAQLVEEDTLMQEEIYRQACKMQAFPNCSDIYELKDLNPLLFNEMEKLAKSYRFDKDVSIEKNIDLNLVFKRVLSKLHEIKNGQNFISMKKMSSNQDFFPQHPELKRWIYLSLYNRVMQSNAHHYQIRGQWKVRDELLKLGRLLASKKLIGKADDVFDLSSDEIKCYLTKLIDVL